MGAVEAAATTAGEVATILMTAIRDSARRASAENEVDED